MRTRLKRIEKSLLSKTSPDVEIIYIEKFRGETKEEAVNRCETEKKIDSKSKHFVFILIPSDEQIRNRFI